MRFSEGPTTSVSVELTASPDIIWERVTDVGLPAANSDELHRAEWVPPATGPELGAKIHGMNRRGDNEWETYSTVTRCDVGECFEWSVDGGVATWAFDIETLADDENPRSRVTQRVTLGPGPSGLTQAIEANPDHEEAIIEARLAQQRAAMEANLEALRLAVEG